MAISSRGTPPVGVMSSIRKGRGTSVFPEEEMRQSSKYVGNVVTSILDTFRMATNGEKTLYDSVTAMARSGISRGLKLSPGRIAFDRNFRFPISLGQPDHVSVENLGKRLLDGVQAKPDTRITKAETDLAYEKRQVVKITLRRSTEIENAGSTWSEGPFRSRSSIACRRRTEVPSRRSWFIWMICGLFPIAAGCRSRNHGGRAVTTGQVRSSSWTRPSTSLRNRPPSESSFPSRCRSWTKRSGLRYPANRIWNITSLPQPHSRGVEKVEFATIPESELPKLPGEREAEPRYELLVLGVMLLGLAIALIVWARRRGHG